MQFDSFSALEQNHAHQILKLPPHAELVFNDRGWTSRVYVYNQGESVVKFPRTEAVKQEYAAEVNAYRLIADHPVFQNSLLRIPKVLAVGPAYEYMAYQGVQGKTLDEYDLTALDLTTVKTRIGKTLGQFLKQFHTLSLPNGQSQSLQDEVNELKHKYRLGKPCLVQNFAPTEIQTIEHFVFNTFAENSQKMGFTPGLCHGDLGLWNLVYDPNKGLGVIDFGDVGIYDTTKDFVPLREPVLLKAALEAYNATETFKAKVSLRQRIHPVLELPYYLGKRNKQGIVDTLKLIKQSLVTPSQV